MSLLSETVAVEVAGLITWKPPVRLVATTNQTLSGLPTIDSVQTLEDDHVLLTAQTAAANNGPWVVKNAGWTRRYDLDLSSEAILGSTWRVQEGTAKAGTRYRLAGPTGAIVVNTTSLTISEDVVTGVVTTVSGTAPIVSTGGTTPAVSITAATTGAAGSMSAADKTKLDGITASAAVASVSGTAPIVSSGGTTPAMSITAASGGAAGSMSAADYTKLAGMTAGAAVASVSGSAPIVSSGGATPAISISAASGGSAGSMSAAHYTKLEALDVYNVTAVKTSAFTSTVGDLVRLDNSSGAFAQTLPTAVGITGRGITYKNTTTGTNAVTVGTTSTQTIDGAPTYVINAARQSVTFVSDGANWLAFPKA